VEYAYGYLSSEVSESFKKNDDPAWFQNFFTSDTQAMDRGQKDDGNFKSILLEPGKLYKMQGSVATVQKTSDTRENIGYRWFNVSQGTFFGAGGGYSAGKSGDYTHGGSGPAIAYLDLKSETAQTEVQLRIYVVSQDPRADIQIFGTNFFIENLQNSSI
jgi:hypothetical protein